MPYLLIFFAFLGLLAFITWRVERQQARREAEQRKALADLLKIALAYLIWKTAQANTLQYPPKASSFGSVPDDHIVITLQISRHNHQNNTPPQLLKTQILWRFGQH